jgi:hypothetical protein
MACSDYAGIRLFSEQRKQPSRAQEKHGLAIAAKEQIMNTKIVWAFVVVMAVWMLSLSGGGKIVSGQDNQENADWKQAKIAYAQAVLEVAQADLAKTREANAKAPATIPSSVVRGLENDVAMAQARVNSMKGLAAPSGESPYLIAAKDALSFAQENLNQALDVNKRVPGAISKVELDRRQADVDLAKARLQAAMLLSKVTPEEAAQWELLQMQEELHDLVFRVGLLQFRN